MSEPSLTESCCLTILLWIGAYVTVACFPNVVAYAFLFERDFWLNNRIICSLWKTLSVCDESALLLLEHPLMSHFSIDSSIKKNMHKTIKLKTSGFHSSNNIGSAHSPLAPQHLSGKKTKLTVLLIINPWMCERGPEPLRTVLVKRLFSYFANLAHIVDLFFAMGIFVFCNKVCSWLYTFYFSKNHGQCFSVYHRLWHLRLVWGLYLCKEEQSCELLVCTVTHSKN